MCLIWLLRLIFFALFLCIFYLFISLLTFDVLYVLSFSSITIRLQFLALRALVRALEELDSVRFVRVLYIVLLIFVFAEHLFEF